MIHTISFGAGSSVSMADANGWQSSGQEESQSHSMVEQLEQKERSELHFSSLLPVRLIALYFLGIVSVVRELMT